MIIAEVVSVGSTRTGRKRPHASSCQSVTNSGDYTSEESTISSPLSRPTVSRKVKTNKLLGIKITCYIISDFHTS